MLTKFRRVFKAAFVNFYRNGWLSLTATLITTLALLTVGVFLLMLLSTRQVTEELKDKIDIVVNFKDTATEATIQQMRSELLARPNLKTVRYISKADALQEFQSRQSVKTEIRNLITAEDNPLPRGLQVQSVELSEFDYVSTLTKDPRFAPFIDSSSYDDNRHLIENVNNASRFVEKFGLILSVFFIVIAILVVFNTVRLAVTFRSKEIEVMRLVGASDLFVRSPFLIEGFLYGLLASVFSLGFIYLGVRIIGTFSKATIFEKFMERLSPIFFSRFWLIAVILIGVGTIIGVGSSWLSVRRNIKI